MLETMYASTLMKKGEQDWMNLTDCPYCNQPGLITTITPTRTGLVVQGKCTICGYSYDSDYGPAEQADDLPGEFMRSLEHVAAD
jgi:hypothetical protein